MASIPEVPVDKTKTITRRKFSFDEDEKICRLVAKYGPDSWDQVAAEFGTNRTARQLRERWQNYVDPHLNPGYTEAEDQKLAELFQEYGPQWAKIAACLGAKSAISARNRYRSLQTLRAKGQKPRYAATVLQGPVEDMVIWDSLSLGPGAADFDQQPGDGILDFAFEW
jgi:myb proto-oncogene protein